MARTRPLLKRPPARGRLDLVLPQGWPQSHAPVFWRWQHGNDTPQSGSVTDLNGLPAAVRSAPAFVWSPASDTVLTTVSLPTRARRKILQALPYALEDRLVGDPETLHYAYRHEADGNLSVAVTARARIQAWLDALTQAGLHPASLCPATLLVPWAVDCWSLVFGDDDILVRSGAVSGFVCSLTVDQPPVLLVAALQEAARNASQAPECLVVFNAPATFPLEAWSATLGLAVRAEKGSMWDKQPQPLAPLNLLQGQYAPSGGVSDALRPFIPALVMLAIWLAGSAVVDGADWWRLRQQHTAFQKDMTAILLENFPETKTVLDPAAQMQRNVEAVLAHSGKSEREFVALLAKTAGALRVEPRIRLRSLHYADHSLTLELTWPAPGSPEAVKRALEAAGLRAEVLGLTARAGEVDGRIRLQPAATPTRPAS